MGVSRARVLVLGVAIGLLLFAGSWLLSWAPWTARPALAASLYEDQSGGSVITPTQAISGTWGPGTITATADVTILPDVVITVAPHTTILVADGVGITVQGELRADGPVTFTTATSPATPGAWKGLIYAPGSAGYLRRTTVEYAEHGLMVNTTNPITLSSSTFRYNRHAPPAGEDGFGAGIAILTGTHLITDTRVYGNVLVATGTGGDAFGGGIDIRGAGSRVVNSFVYANEITSTLGFAVGGGIAIRGDGNATLIEGCEVTTNTLHALGVDNVSTYGEGAGIGIPEGNRTRAVIRGNLIASNENRSVVASGGGIGLAGGAEAASIEDNVVYNNLCESPGGNLFAMDNYWAEGGGIDAWEQNVVTVTNNLILSNTVRCVNRCYQDTGPVGGGMLVNGRSVAAPVRVVNNTVVGNRAEGQTSGGYGGAFGAQAYGVFANNIIVDNSCSADSCGGAFYWWDGVSSGYNDLWNNAPDDYSGTPPASRPGEIVLPPLFADADLWGYHLSLASPARDRGTCIDAPAADFEGDARPLGWGCDIGWDETGYLIFSKHADRTTASPGLPIQYTIRITNTDRHVYAPVVVSDTLDSHLHWVSGGTVVSGAVVLSGTVSPGGTIDLSFTAAANWGVPDGTVVTNTAYVSDGRYISPTNSVTTTIYSPVLTVTKEATDVVVGTPLTYTLHVRNTGAGVATNVVVTDALPAGATYLSGGVESGGVVSWTIPTIDPGGERPVTLTVRTCRESLINEHYRVVTSTQGIASPPGPALTTSLTPPSVVASFVYSPATPVAGETVFFTSTSTTDGSPLVDWSWDFDDGTGSGETISHTYTAPGVYRVTFVVTDGCGYTATTTVLVEIYATLTVHTVGDGSVTVDPDKSLYSYGEVVTLTATPDTGWAFVGWGGDLTGGDNPAALTVTGNSVVTATFEQEEYTLTVDVVGGGDVTVDPDRPTYHYGEVVTLTAVPDAGWAFVGWGGDLTGGDNPVTLTVTGDSAVTATFERRDHTVTVNVVGEGMVGVAPDRATHPHGTAVTLTAVPDPGWAFAGWSGDLTGTDNPLSFTITKDTVVTALFEEEEYTLTVNIIGDGVVMIEPDQPTYHYGDVVTIAAVPGSTWLFAGWGGDISGSSNPNTIVITGDTVVTVVFYQYRLYLPVVLGNHQGVADLPVHSMEWRE